MTDLKGKKYNGFKLKEILISSLNLLVGSKTSIPWPIRRNGDPNIVLDSLELPQQEMSIGNSEHGATWLLGDLTKMAADAIL